MAWGRVSCNSKMASLSCGLRELVSLQTSRESSAIDRVTVLKLSIVWVVRVNDQTPPSCRVAKSQPIRDFPAIEHGMVSANQRLSHH